MKRLVLVRHGQSLWNKLNLFTGWVDVDLSVQGIEEAVATGKKLKEKAFEFDIVYTSVLIRAIKTAYLILNEMNLLYLPFVKSWRLNERHYGALQGLNKEETGFKYGPLMVQKWRRSYDILPPEIDEEKNYKMCIDKRYQDVDKKDIPKGESLKTTLERVIPFYECYILKSLETKQSVLVVAHGNSLRALIKHLEKISDEDIMKLELATGSPIVYEFDDNMNLLRKYNL